MVEYDLNAINKKYDDIVNACNDDELKEVITKCKYIHDYFDSHFSDSYSSEKAHYHLHFAQEAISEYILDKLEC